MQVAAAKIREPGDGLIIRCQGVYIAINSCIKPIPIYQSLKILNYFTYAKVKAALPSSGYSSPTVTTAVAAW